MIPQTFVFGIVKGLHDLFSAVWIGGLIALALAVMPASRQVLGDGPELKRLMGTIQQRLSRLIYASIAVLVVTGMLEARRNAQFSGLFGFGNPYASLLSVKHILVIVMIVIAVYRSVLLSRQSPEKTGKLGQVLMLLNIVLGVVIMFLSGLDGALA